MHFAVRCTSSSRSVCWPGLLAILHFHGVTRKLCACRDFEKEASQKQREARPALEKVKSAEETVEAVEDQVRRAEDFANSVDEELKAVMEQLRSDPLP